MQKLFDKILHDAHLEINSKPDLKSKNLSGEIYARHKIGALSLDIYNRKISEVEEHLDDTNTPLNVPIQRGAKYKFVLYKVPFKGDVSMLDYAFVRAHRTREVYIDGNTLIIKICIYNNSEDTLTAIKQKAKTLIERVKASLDLFNSQASAFNENVLKLSIDKQIEDTMQKKEEKANLLTKLDPFL